VIQYAEVLLEMGAKKRWGDKGRWRTIVGIEALKSLPLPNIPRTNRGMIGFMRIVVLIVELYVGLDYWV
jgi:hypothetical protein